MTLLLALAVVAAGGLGGLAAIVAKGRTRFARANQVVPGVATTAPGSWAGTHSPEARLHRRLRDAVAALRANRAPDDVGLLEARVVLERHALAVDERLVAVAALPARVRSEPLASVASAVDAVETAVASLLAADLALEGRSGLDQAMAEVAERRALLAEARAELDEPPVRRPQTG